MSLSTKQIKDPVKACYKFTLHSTDGLLFKLSNSTNCFSKNLFGLNCLIYMWLEVTKKVCSLYLTIQSLKLYFHHIPKINFLRETFQSLNVPIPEILFPPSQIYFLSKNKEDNLDEIKFQELVGLFFNQVNLYKMNYRKLFSGKGFV